MIVVIKRDGEREEFSTEKIALSIMGAASKFGGEDYELADQISEDILDRLEESDITEIAAEELQSVVEKELIEQGHAATAKEYILTSANRERVREMNSHLMKTLEDLTFSDAAEVKKENANIDSDTAMGTMLKYGSEAAKRFNVTYMMSKDVAEAHQNGDIHIHDLDFFSLTETCVTDDTLLNISENGEHKEVRADYFDKFLEDESCDSIVYLAGFKVKSGDEYVKLKNCVKHSSADKKVLKISSQLGEICVTSEHRVCIQRGDEIKDVRASEVVTGDKLLAYTDKGMTPSYVCSVKEIKYTGFVYDFETANHYFNANGFRVHNCCQIPLDKLFKDGFNTGHGFLREPGNIRTAGALAAIAIQSNQNDQHKRVMQLERIA